VLIVAIIYCVCVQQYDRLYGRREDFYYVGAAWGRAKGIGGKTVHVLRASSYTWGHVGQLVGRV